VGGLLGLGGRLLLLVEENLVDIVVVEIVYVADEGRSGDYLACLQPIHFAPPHADALVSLSLRNVGFIAQGGLILAGCSSPDLWLPGFFGELLSAVDLHFLISHGRCLKALLVDVLGQTR
jgi:hypothetical protein